MSSERTTERNYPQCLPCLICEEGLSLGTEQDREHEVLDQDVTTSEDSDDLFMDDPDNVLSSSSKNDDNDHGEESHDVALYMIPGHVGPRPSITPYIESSNDTLIHDIDVMDVHNVITNITV
ncbi:hypothetical protein L6452_22231 [Arctium lappa]|uniref:Uncharacterized protein n=1 Tax=Arctium lappa TaxID=4217 RepID=A0ACB9AZK8_ARCLA|nr:hypothetical protein L6452_22231 [Arctium lappa]